MLASKEMCSDVYINNLIKESMQAVPQDHSHIAESGSDEEWEKFIKAIQSYQLVKISVEQYYRWLEVLPPAKQGFRHFLFAEGEELPRLFFKRNECYYCVRMRHTDPAIQDGVDRLEARMKELEDPRSASVYLDWSMWLSNEGGCNIAFFGWKHKHHLIPEIDQIMREHGFINYKDRFNWYWHHNYWGRNDLATLAERAGVKLKFLDPPSQPFKA